MADESEETEETDAQLVELGEGISVEGAPISQLTSRLTWPQEKSEIERKFGDSIIRTPSGPQSLSEILSNVDTTYFATRREFVTDIRGAMGTGPVSTQTD